MMMLVTLNWQIISVFFIVKIYLSSREDLGKEAYNTATLTLTWSSKTSPSYLDSIKHKIKTDNTFPSMMCTFNSNSSLPTSQNFPFSTTQVIITAVIKCIHHLSFFPLDVSDYLCCQIILFLIATYKPFVYLFFN